MDAPPLKASVRLCSRCGTEAETLAGRLLTTDDCPALVTGPACYGYILMCPVCGRTWLVLAADTGCWYGMESDATH